MSTTALSLEIANQLGILPSETLVGYLTNKLNEFGVQSLSDIQEGTVPDERTIDTVEPLDRPALINVRTGQEIPSRWGGPNTRLTAMLATDGYGTTIDITVGKITRNFDQRTKLARQIVDRMDWNNSQGPAWKALGTNYLGIPNLAYEIADRIRNDWELQAFQEAQPAIKPGDLFFIEPPEGHPTDESFDLKEGRPYLVFDKPQNGAEGVIIRDVPKDQFSIVTDSNGFSQFQYNGPPRAAIPAYQPRLQTSITGLSPLHPTYRIQRSAITMSSIVSTFLSLISIVNSAHLSTRS